MTYNADAVRLMKSLIFPWYDWNRHSLNDFSKHISRQLGRDWRMKLAITRRRHINGITSFEQVTKLIFPWLTSKSLDEAVSMHKFKTWQQNFYYERNRCLREEWFIKKVVPLSHLEEDFIHELESIEALMGDKNFSRIYKIWSRNININKWLEQGTTKFLPLESKYLMLVKDNDKNSFLGALLEIAIGAAVF